MEDKSPEDKKREAALVVIIVGIALIAVGALVACMGLLAFVYVPDQPKPAAHFAAAPADTATSPEQLE